MMWRGFFLKVLSTKFITTAGSLLAVFVLAYTGKDVRQLEVVIPAILAFYHASNVAQKHVLKSQGAQDGSVNSDVESN